MEGGAGNPGRDPHKPPLSLFRILKAACILFILVSSAFSMLLFLAPLVFFLLRLYSIHHSRRVVSFFFGHWLAIWPFFFEKVNGAKVIFSGHQVPPGERVILLCNHRTEVDWMYIWSLALRKGRIGSVKYVVKSSVRNAPIFGWAFYVLEFLLIDRKWQVDEAVFQNSLKTFKSSEDPLWLVIFPEGTDYSEEKCLSSQKFAEENGLPKLNHVLLPRTKGCYACLTHLRNSIDAVYDLTIGYKNRCPLFLDNALGTDPKEVHIHVQRIPISSIPTTEDETSTWLVKQYAKKDQLLSTFYREGNFPDSGREHELSMLMGTINFISIVIFSFILLRLMFLSCLWLKIYSALSCICLTAATYFNYKPQALIQIGGAKANS